MKVPPYEVEDAMTSTTHIRPPAATIDDSQMLSQIARFSHAAGGARSVIPC
jgi:hypothetical protein